MKKLAPFFLLLTLLGSAPAQAGALRKLLCFLRLAKPEDNTEDRGAVFPNFGMMIAKELGIKRPKRIPTPKLPPLPDPHTLPNRALGMIMDRMGQRQNWSDVARAASNIRTEKQQLMAEWMREDSIAIVNDLLAQLTPEQKKIVAAAWAGGMAERPPYPNDPEVMTLEWVIKNCPPR